MHLQLVFAAIGSIWMVTNAANIAKRYDDVGNVRTIDTALQNEFTSRHRTLRSNLAGTSPGASNMEDIVWDDALATKASGWVAKCYFEHPKSQYSDEAAYVTDGQNLFASSQEEDSPNTPTEIVDNWDAEKQWYTYGNSNPCSPPADKSCGHYVQVVYSTASKVGCGMAYCSTLYRRDGTTLSFGGWFAACNYETGVTTGADPYSEGSKCTNCPSGKAYCKDNMCADCDVSDSDCTCELSSSSCGDNGSLQNCVCSCNEGWTGSDCSVQCVDSDTQCGDENYEGRPYIPSSWCDQQWVKNKCNKMCGVC